MTDPYYNSIVPAHVAPQLVHDFNIYDPEYEDLDLFQSFRRLHEIGLPEIFWTRNNGGHWIARRGAVIAEVARDADRFSSKRMFVPDEQNFASDFFVPLQADPPAHAGYRSIAAPLFASGRIAKLEEGVRTLAGKLISELRMRGECEFTKDFALQMPVIVFLQLLDLPISDRPRLLKIADRVVRQPPEGEKRDDAMQEMFNYLRPILEARLAHPGSDVISQLVTGTINGWPLSADERMGLSATILTGGLDSVAATLGLFTRYLAESPAARRRLIGEPKIIPAAIDELLRRFPPTTHGRSVSRDITFRSVDMREREHVVWAAAMYNFDDELFPEPMKVDFNRKRTANLSFGTGIHVCAGASLARLELRIFLEEWLKHIPDFEIKPGVTVRYRPGINIGLQSLPLQWAV